MKFKCGIRNSNSYKNKFNLMFFNIEADIELAMFDNINCQKRRSKEQSKEGK